MADDKIRVVIDADASNLQRELRKAGIQVNTFGRQVNDQSRGVRAFTAATDKQRQTLHEVGRAAVVGGAAVAAGAALAAAHIVKTGMAYEAEMSRVDGVVDGTAKQMSMLNRVALRLGAETKFSATEAAQGMYELGSAGFKAGQMTGALQGTLSLAAASGIELAMAADIAAAAIKGFQLKAGDATHVSDVLAKAANTTALKMDDLQLSMKYIAPIAVTTGQSFETMVAALGVMGDAGIRGEQAGTTLRAGLLRLVKPTSMVKDGLAELGLQSSELYGPDGLLPLPEIVAKLSVGMEDLSQSQRAAALSGIFGQEAVSGMLTIIDAGPAKLERLTRGFESSAGASAQAAKIMQDNVAGAWEQVTGSIESLEIAVYQQFEEPIKDALLEVSTALDREGPKIQSAFQNAMATPEFKSGDLSQQIGVLGQVAQDEWQRLGLGDDLRKISADALSATIPVMAEGGAEIGLAVAKGLVGGFLESDVWGKLLIGGFLFAKLGGFAAIRAAGFSAGSQAAAGAAAGMAAGGGAGAAAGAAGAGGLLAKGASLARGVGKAGLWAAAITGGIEAADMLVNNSADNLQARLAQLDQQGSGLLGSMDRLFDGITEGWMGMEADDSISDQGDRAHELLKVLSDVNNVGAERAQQLRAQGRELLQNLDLTEKEKRAAEDILNFKPKLGVDAQAGIDKLASGYITRMADITKLARENAAAAVAAYGENTPQWRSAMARNMNATVTAIRSGMADGVIEVDKGQKKIRQLLRRRDLVTGNNVGDIAKGFRRTWLNAGTINRSGINRMLKDLGQMPVGARKKAASMMIQMAQAMEKNGRLPEGAASKLRSAIISEFNIAANQGAGKIKRLQNAAAEGGRAWGRSLDGMGKDAKSGMDTAGRSIDKGTAEMGSAWKRSAADARNYARQVQTAVTSIPPVTGAAYGSLRDQTNTVMAAYDSDKSISYAFRRGGVAPFGGSGLVDGMFSPGEKLVHGNNVAYVPGKPEARDSVHLRVPEGTGVLTWDGQAREAAGESLDSAIRNQAPHFREGGPVGNHLKRPVLTGGASVPRSAGQGGINMAEQAAEKWIEQYMASNTGEVRDYRGIRMADWVIGALEFAAKKGTAPQPTSGYRSQAENNAQGRFYLSEHSGTVYPHGAVDYGGFTTGMSAKMSVVDATRDYRFPLLAPIGFADDGHASGTGHRIGGYVKSRSHSGMLHSFFREGGSVGGCSCESCQRNRKGGVVGYRGGGKVGWGERVGNHWDNHELASLAHAVGMKRPGYMAQIANGESSGDPNAVGDDAAAGFGNTFGYGLWQITSTYHDDKIAAAGGAGTPGKGIFHPVQNALAAKKILDTEGLGAWYADPRGPLGKVQPWLSRAIRASSGVGKQPAGMGGGKGGKGGESEAEEKKSAAQKKKRARIRQRRLRKLRARGIPRKMLREDGKLVGRIASLQDDIDQTTTRSQWDTSPGGEEQTDGEVRLIVALLERELGTLRDRRRLLKRKIRQPLRRRLKQSEGEIKAATPSRIKKNGKWVKNPAHTNLGALKSNRTSVRDALRDATTNLRDVAGYNEKEGGEILRVKNEIRGYGAKASEPERDSETADLLREQLRDSQRNLALGESQFGIFKQFLSGLGPGMPYLGAFAMGTAGKRVGSTGMALLHEDEIVTPAPKGPYGTNLSASGSSTPNVTLVLAGDAQHLVKVVDARIDGRTARIEQRVDRSLGRKQRQISVAPGR